MTCPSCGAGLETVEREGVEIERCPECRGVWLDRGELEKLVAMSARQQGAVYEQKVDGNSDDVPEPAEKLATRRSFFAELFDVD